MTLGTYIWKLRKDHQVYRIIVSVKQRGISAAFAECVSSKYKAVKVMNISF